MEIHNIGASIEAIEAKYMAAKAAYLAASDAAVTAFCAYADADAAANDESPGLYRTYQMAARAAETTFATYRTAFNDVRIGRELRDLFGDQ